MVPRTIWSTRNRTLTGEPDFSQWSDRFCNGQKAEERCAHKMIVYWMATEIQRGNYCYPISSKRKL